MKKGVIKIKDIVDTALENDAFSTLCKAVITAGLVDALRSRFLRRFTFAQNVVR